MIRAAGLRDLDTLESIERASFGSDAWSAAQLRDELQDDRIVLVHVGLLAVPTLRIPSCLLGLPSLTSLAHAAHATAGR